ncbi:hypothetical protein OESDEN_00095 [Oesophagostomum dentatum]|uniref:Uncharacterized protein n=1 Tax=Oesophagostomum dentatum TaxID=61180 RepID=A0A0B1TWQ6_OESDE|nr:hypothetical protein OESDEN_00095 [Oesophagostomum dentatum]
MLCYVTLLLMNLVSFLAIRCIVPYFLLPYIAMSVFSLFIATALIGVTNSRLGLDDAANGYKNSLTQVLNAVLAMCLAQHASSLSSTLQ